MTPATSDILRNGSDSHLESLMANHSNAIDVQQAETAELQTLSGVVSDDQLKAFESVMHFGFISVMAYVGIVNNILTIIVFVKMGFKETVNISMTALTIWYLVRCTCDAITKVSGVLTLISFALGTSWRNVATVTCSVTGSIATYVSGILATFIAIERCLCISKPLAVKHILTRKFVTVSCVVLSTIVFGSCVVAYARYDIVTVRDPISNETIWIFKRNAVLRAKHPAIYSFSHYMSVVYPAVSFGITCACTIIIFYHLIRASKFRSGIKADSDTNESTQLSSRDKQVVKMLLVIITIYMICILPRIVFFLCLRFVPGLFAGSRYNNLYWLGLGIVTFFASIDSSMNIYIFYSMSSQFNQTLKEILHLAPKKGRPVRN